MRYALFARPAVTVYDQPEPTAAQDGQTLSTIGDEGLYGQCCQVLGEAGPLMVRVRTFYGYPG